MLRLWLQEYLDTPSDMLLASQSCKEKGTYQKGTKKV